MESQFLVTKVGPDNMVCEVGTLTSHFPRALSHPIEIRPGRWLVWSGEDFLTVASSAPAGFFPSGPASLAVRISKT